MRCSDSRPTMWLRKRSARTEQRAARRGPGTSDAVSARRPAGSAGRHRREGVPTKQLSDVLEVFARFETNGPAGRDAHFLAGARVASDAALARFHLEDSEPAQLDAFAALLGGPHRVEDRVD